MNLDIFLFLALVGTREEKNAEHVARARAVPISSTSWDLRFYLLRHETSIPS